MARLTRLVFPGVALHVIQRGNNRNACFREDSDYLTYLAQLRQLTTKHECDLHAYCLMADRMSSTSTAGTLAAARSGKAGFARAWWNPRAT